MKTYEEILRREIDGLTAAGYEQNEAETIARRYLQKLQWYYTQKPPTKTDNAKEQAA